MDHADVMNRCDEKGRHVGLAALSDVERTEVLVSWFNFEVECGGFTTFYYNSAGDNAVATVRALVAVGAKHAAKALRAGNRLYPEGVPPANRQERFIAKKKIKAKGCDDPFSKCDDKFAKEDPDVFTKLCNYMDQHAAELREHISNGKKRR
jgi:hypothetical protein